MSEANLRQNEPPIQQCAWCDATVKVKWGDFCLDDDLAYCFICPVCEEENEIEEWGGEDGGSLVTLPALVLTVLIGAGVIAAALFSILK